MPTPTTNFKVFNEANDAANTYNDSEYQNATQRQTGVIPGMALSRMHNKMYYQWSTMSTAIAQYLVSKGYDCMDDDIQGIEDALAAAIGSAAEDLQPFLRQPSTYYAVGAVVYLPAMGAAMYLECTTAGTTDSGDLVISTPTPGNTVNDGTVVWTIKKAGSDPNALTREVTPAFNSRDVITTSGTYTAPVTGWYKITVKGGGGGAGGAGIMSISGQAEWFGGCGGGEGGTTIEYVQMTAGNTATVVVGGGGSGGASTANGTDGGNTTVTIDGNTYTASGGGGGACGTYVSSTKYGAGGSGTITGNSGTVGTVHFGGAGGGASNGYQYYNGIAPSPVANSGAGGSGTASGGTGASGADGFVWFEYFATI